MTRILILFALMLSGVTFVSAQKMDMKETNEQALMRMEKEIAAGLVKGDTMAFEKYTADSAALVDPFGMLATKAEAVAAFKGGIIKFDMIDLSDIKVMMHGDTAIVTYVTMDKGVFKNPANGKEIMINQKNRWTDTWVNMKGKWMCVSTQGTGIMAM